MIKDPLIHIGMPKCASSWLQRRFLKRPHGYRRCFGPLQAQLGFIDPRPFEWTRPRHIGLKQPDGLVPTITCEMLAGNPLTGGADGEMILSRLHRAIPQARILMVIREQGAMLRSLYQLLVNWGCPYAIDTLLGADLPGNVPRFDPAYLRFDRIISAYQQAFGRERVLVLPLELLQRDALRFLGQINRFAGVDESEYPIHADASRRDNPGRGLASLECKRLYNRYLARTAFDIGGPLRPAQIQAVGNLDLKLPAFLDRRQERRFRARVNAHLGNYYRQSNARTQALTGLDLGSLGYQLPDLAAPAPAL